VAAAETLAETFVPVAVTSIGVSATVTSIVIG
jgi:hypothetical protein